MPDQKQLETRRWSPCLLVVHVLIVAGLFILGAWLFVQSGQLEGLQDKVRAFETKRPMTQPAIDGLEIAERVESYYNRAWIMLIGLVTLGAGVVGVLVPLVVQHLQTRSFDKTEQKFRKDLDQAQKNYEETLARQVNELRKEAGEAQGRLATTIDEKTNDGAERLTSLMEKRFASLTAGVYMVQAETKGTVNEKAWGYAKVAQSVVAAGEHALIDLQMTLRYLVDLLGRLDKSQVTDPDDVEEAVEVLLKTLEQHPQEYEYAQDVSAIREALKAAKAREPEVEEESEGPEG